MALNSLLPATVITAAAANVVSQTIDLKVAGQKLPLNMAAQVKFTYGSGGTSVTVWIQTSFDGGNTWCDVMVFAFLTASLRKAGNVNRQTAVTPVAMTDGSGAADAKTDGLIGQQWRAKYTSVGTYGTSTTLQVDIIGEN